MNNISFKVETITPEKAAKILVMNNRNRPVNTAHISLLAREMSSNEWQLTGQGIIISDDGDLLDGQHRMKAVIESGKSIKTLVTRGVKPEAMDVIDTSARPRSPSDIFNMRGYKHAVTLASSINVLNNFSGGGRFNRCHLSARRLSQGQYDTYYDTFPQLQEWAAFAATCGNRIIPQSIIAGVGVIFEYTEDKDGDSRKFFELLDSGAGLEAGSPILVLRNKLIKAKIQKDGRMRQEFMVWYTIKAWNLFIKHKTAKVLSIGGTEKMPLIHGFDAKILPYYVE